MKKTIGFMIFFLGSILFIISNCNNPEILSVYDKQFNLTNDSSVIYQSDRRYFILVPQDTAFFCGIQSCTLLVNGIVNADSTKSDSLYFRTITLDTTSLSINYKNYTVFPQIYQWGRSIDELKRSGIKRYFHMNDTAILQIAYASTLNNELHSIPGYKQKVFPRILYIGKFGYFETDSTNAPSNNKWYTSPIIEQPISTYTGNISFEGFSVAPEPIAYPITPKLDSGPPYHINGFKYRHGVFIKTLYTLSGDIRENNKVARISGVVKITRTFFVDRGMIDQLINTSIQKRFSDGTVEIKRKTSYISRPDLAKTYPETF